MLSESTQKPNDPNESGINCSKSHAYKLVKAMNKELSAQGYITMAGRIPKAFWAKKMYGYEIAGN